MPMKIRPKTLTVADSKPAVQVVPVEGFAADTKPKAVAFEPSIQIRLGNRATSTVNLTLKQARELAAHLTATTKALRPNRKRVRSQARKIGA